MRRVRNALYNNHPLFDEQQMREEALIATGLTFDVPSAGDAADVWRLIRDCPPLDLNTPYCYMLMCDDFADTTVVVRDEGKIVACITGMRLPRKPEALFIWQVAVAESHRRQGMGHRMMRAILARDCNADMTHIETTVSPSNKPSRAMFRTFAEKLGVPMETIGEFGEDLFPAEASEAAHEEETRFRIGPFNQAAIKQENK